MTQNVRVSYPGRERYSSMLPQELTHLARDGRVGERLSSGKIVQLVPEAPAGCPRQLPYLVANLTNPFTK